MTPLQRLLVAFMGLAIGLVHAGPVGLEASFETGLDKRAVCYLDGTFAVAFGSTISGWV